MRGACEDVPQPVEGLTISPWKGPVKLAPPVQNIPHPRIKGLQQSLELLFPAVQEDALGVKITHRGTAIGQKQLGANDVTLPDCFHDRR